MCRDVTSICTRGVRYDWRRGRTGRLVTSSHFILNTLSRQHSQSVHRFCRRMESKAHTGYSNSEGVSRIELDLLAHRIRSMSSGSTSKARSRHVGVLGAGLAGLRCADGYNFASPFTFIYFLTLSTSSAAPTWLQGHHLRGKGSSRRPSCAKRPSRAQSRSRPQLDSWNQR